MTAVLVDEILQEKGLRIQDCEAVCVSKGPGSYTGLRVGVSSAKGLCFGAGIPLLAVGTLDILVAQALQGETPDSVGGDGLRYDAIIPVIDARRDEVYTAVYTQTPDQVGGDGLAAAPQGVLRGSSSVMPGYDRASSVRALIVGQDEFDTDIDGRAILFIGDAADKCRRLLAQAPDQVGGDGETTAPRGVMPGPDRASRWCFVQTQPRADAMAELAEQAFERGAFEDVAYFEPFYLKDFVATTPKKLF